MSWASGSFSNTYTNVNGSGVDVTVSITGNTNQTSAAVTGGQGGAGNSLFLLANYSNTNQQVVVTVSFSQAVSNVNYTLFDVDQGNRANGNKYTFTDQISHITSSNGAATYASTLSTVGSGSTIGINGTGTSQIAFGTGASSPTQNLGNLTVNNGSQYVTSSTFAFGSYNNNSQNNPSQQGISLGNISFDVIPEPSWALASVLLCFWVVWKSKQRAKRCVENGLTSFHCCSEKGLSALDRANQAIAVKAILLQTTLKVEGFGQELQVIAGFIKTQDVLHKEYVII